MSDRNLTEAEKSILSKGPKFAVTPKMNPINFAAPVESALQHPSAPDQAKEAPRIKIREATRKAVRPLLNVKKEAWKDLKGDRTIRILQADKGNGTVVLNATERDKKVKRLASG